MFKEIARILIKNNLTIAVTESCTGGLLSSMLTDVSGSSAYTHLNFVTYSNEAKHKILGVKNETLNLYGAVSEECSFEMAKGLHSITQADICVSTTGIAGPTGGTENKPVGLMFATIYTTNCYKTFKFNLPSQTPRIQMKQAFVQSIAEKLYDFLIEYEKHKNNL